VLEHTPEAEDNILVFEGPVGQERLCGAAC
jgi:hypothetical protein